MSYIYMHTYIKSYKTVDFSEAEYQNFVQNIDTVNQHS
jgi:hypothetical protein